MNMTTALEMYEGDTNVAAQTGCVWRLETRLGGARKGSRVAFLRERTTHPNRKGSEKKSIPGLCCCVRIAK